LEEGRVAAHHHNSVAAYKHKPIRNCDAVNLSLIVDKAMDLFLAYNPKLKRVAHNRAWAYHLIGIRPNLSLQYIVGADVQPKFDIELAEMIL